MTDNEIAYGLSGFNRIWERVENVQGSACHYPTAMRNETNMMRLRAFIAEECAAAAVYDSLASRSRDANIRRMLLSVAADERRHHRSLQVEYFLRSGDTMPPVKIKMECDGFITALRSAHSDETAAAAGYKEAAAEADARLAALYRANADDESRHAELLHGIIYDILI